ncbi:gustatory receptor for sugar taste 64f-like [Phlebotomus papatasi]|uniref:gustatory receptor for sugar taste 64f-like n=1 Tax=Phlebotomus papatasi TaxID=29031 RepID=UPI002483D7F8|nr:gustatory receptor for sugar taste 64f-like [Phlebotomus papatasi]
MGVVGRSGATTTVAAGGGVAMVASAGGVGGMNVVAANMGSQTNGSKKSNSGGGFNASFHESLKPVIFVGQCASLLPVSGTQGERVEDLQCSIKSFRMLYSCVICVALGVMCLLSLRKLINNRLAYEKLITLINYSLLFWACAHFIRLARKWPSTMNKWTEIERILPNCEQHCNRISTKKKLYILVIVVTILTIIEEALSIIAGITKAKSCIGIWDSVERYFKQSFPQIFSLIQYHEVTAVFAQIVQLYANFIWNFVDMFVMSISIGLSSVLRQFNTRLKIVEGKCMPVAFWAQQKKDYQLLCGLIEMMDRTMAHIIVQSFFSNLYYICVQLLNSLKYLFPNLSRIFFMLK